MLEEEPIDVTPASATVPPPPAVPGPRFWTTRRVVVAIATVLAILLAAWGGYALTLGPPISAEAAALAKMRTFVSEGYPDYRIIDSTRSGYILQHKVHEALRLDVRFVSAGLIGVWKEAPRETLTPGWSTAETFFRHAEGLPPDPRTGMNYDVAGFVEAYTPLRPGPESVVSAVWLDGTDAAGVETYIVLVARRNRTGRFVESMWPDHGAYFRRDSKTGKWTGAAFKPAYLDNPNN